MRMGRAHKDQMGQSLTLQIVSEAALSGDERGVFQAPYGVAAAKTQGSQCGVDGGVHGVPRCANVCAACCTALTIFT